MKENIEPDLSSPIMGLVEFSAQNNLLPQQRIVFSLFVGGVVTRTAIMIDEIDVPCAHPPLERFTGTDVSNGDSEPGLSPGTKVTGMKHLAYGFVFLTEVDGKTVPQHSGYYEDDDDPIY